MTTWAISGVDELGAEWTPARTFIGNQAVLQFPAVGHYRLSVAQRDDSSGIVSRAEGELICRYVRREIRTLSEEDRELFFNTFHAMSSINSARGTVRNFYLRVYLYCPVSAVR